MIVWFEGFNEASDLVYSLVEAIKKSPKVKSNFTDIINKIFKKLHDGNLSASDEKKYSEELSNMFDDKFLTIFVNKEKNKYSDSDMKSITEWFNKKMRDKSGETLFKAIKYDYKDGSHEIKSYLTDENKKILSNQSIERGKEKFSTMLKGSDVAKKKGLSEIRRIVREVIMENLKVNVDSVMKYFKSINSQISEKTSEWAQNPKDNDALYDEIKKLKEERQQYIKNMAIGNQPDEMEDEVHDSILDDGNGFPSGYKAVIITSFRNGRSPYVNLPEYRTIAYVQPPNGNGYYVSVPTTEMVKPNTVYQGT